MPIYYVVWEQEFGTQLSMMYSIRKIIAVFPCDTSQIREIWDTQVVPLQIDNRRIGADIYVREPDNPFKVFVNNEQEQS